MRDWTPCLRITITSLLIAAALLSYQPPLNSNCLPDTYSFLLPDIIDQQAPGAAFFLDFQRIYERYGQQAENQVQDNVNEWYERFCKIVDGQDIYELVYKAERTDLEGLLEATRNDRFPLPVRLRSNGFADYLNEHGCTETVQYLVYAKTCEPYVTNPDPWKNDEAQLEEVKQLAVRGQSAFINMKSHYVRLRYAYQVIRLYHYAGLYREAINYLMPKTDNDPSILEYWIEGHYAGALMALGQTVKANYLYSHIFEHAPSKRESAFNSFRVKNAEEWQQVLVLCKTDAERATLYAMRGHVDGSRALEEMLEIYQLDPGSHHLDILLLQEVKKLEQRLLGLEFNDKAAQNRRYFDRSEGQAADYLIEIQDFVRALVREKRINNLDLWRVVEGYLYVIGGDSYAAQETLQRARGKIRDDKLRSQVEAFLLVNKIASLRRLNDETERFMAEVRLNDPIYSAYRDFPNFHNDKMTWFYRSYDEPAKLFLQKHDMKDLKANPQIRIVDSLLQLARLPYAKRNRYERLLLRELGNETNLERILLDIKGTDQLFRGKTALAQTFYAQIDPVQRAEFGPFNPFIETLNDCVNCNLQDTTTRQYSRYELIERLNQLETRAIADTAGSRYLYQIGLAYYNMSYFGYDWRAMDYFRSGSSLKRPRVAGKPNVVRDPRLAYGNREQFDCSRALQYFDRARQLADRNGRRELAAKATFMAARCEQNAHFAYQTPLAYTYFGILKEQYQDTRFYARAVQECKYFRYYSTQ